jgi:hypothetical protein
MVVEAIELCLFEELRSAFRSQHHNFFMNSACSVSSSFGGGVVRVTTGVPTAAKDSSCPAGEQMQSSRVALEDVW